MSVWRGLNMYVGSSAARTPAPAYDAWYLLNTNSAERGIWWRYSDARPNGEREAILYVSPPVPPHLVNPRG